MVDQIEIYNFKSIVDMTLHLGRFNVIIGANGCGKTNILEAIAFAGAAAKNKLDYEYLLNRDIRVTDPKFMLNAFDDEEEDRKSSITAPDTLTIKLLTNRKPFLCQLRHDEDSKVWVNITDLFNNEFNKLLSEEPTDFTSIEQVYHALQENLLKSEVFKNGFRDWINELRHPAPEIADFLTYRPTEHFLRRTFDSTLFPFGVHGEGLLKYLKEEAERKETRLFSDINDGLELLDWFDGFSIPENLMTDEYRLTIGDRYLKESLHYFDQRSTNEGFLFLLFYLTLFNSRQSPRFFAIDNLETAFNPKLTTKLTEYLVKRSFENDKQVILTTHSPFVLDALDLGNDDVRLFVCRRNIDGHTRIERIPYKADRTMSLSQLWMSGLIGGLPDNF